MIVLHLHHINNLKISKMKDLQEILKITTNAFSFAKEMMFALKDKIINYDEYAELSEALKLHCKNNNIETSLNNISLF